jgi:hypothetical protein
VRTVLIAIALLALAACDSGPAPSVAAPVSHFENDVVSFEYPANWNALVPAPPSDPDTMVFLSTEQLAETDPRVTQLGEDGVYIAWTTTNKQPLTTPDPSFSSEVTVGGRPAVVSQDVADGDCATIGGGELLIVRIASPSGQDDIEVISCVRGPNVSLTGAAIAGMLASVLWK